MARHQRKEWIIKLLSWVNTEDLSWGATSEGFRAPLHETFIVKKLRVHINVIRFDGFQPFADFK